MFGFLGTVLWYVCLDFWILCFVLCLGIVYCVLTCLSGLCLPANLPTEAASAQAGGLAQAGILCLVEPVLTLSATLARIALP